MTLCKPFSKRAIDSMPTDGLKSGLYLDFLLKLNMPTMRLVDHPRLTIIVLEKRIARGGKDLIDHPSQGHDDVANVVSGVTHCAMNRHTSWMMELRI